MRTRVAGLVLGLLTVAILSAGEAERLYNKGREAEKKGNYAAAYLRYSEAAALDPGNTMYWLRSQAVRSRAALQGRPVPPPGAQSTPSGEPGEIAIDPVTPKDLDEARKPLPPAELQTNVGPQDFDLHADARALYEKVARAYGFDCVFDGDFEAGRPVRFRVEQAGYREALRALEAATGTFIVPLSPKLFLVAKDSDQKRKEIEPHVSVTIDIPTTTSAQEMMELARGVQQALAIERIGWDSQRHIVVFRGPLSKVLPAQRLFQDLILHRPQVAMEIEVVEVSRNDFVTWGLNLPNTFSISSLQSGSKIVSTIADLARWGPGGTAFGIAVANANLVAQMNQASGRTLLQMQLRSVDGQAASFHVGDRYPILTSSYVGELSPGTTGRITPGTGSTSTSGSDDSLLPQQAVFGNISRPAAVVIGDFDEDGIADLAAAASGAKSVAILLGVGDGTFGEARSFPAGENPSGLAVADLDDDGALDLVTANAGSNDVSVLFGNGDGSFEDAVPYAVGPGPAAVAIADFNRDGIPDIAAANSNSNTVSILLARNDGTFRSAFTVPAGPSPRALVAADFNSDQNPDLAVANFTSNDVSILLSNGDGTFRESGTYPAGNSPRGIAAANLNPGIDLTTDLVIADSASNSLTVFLGDGAGGFVSGGQFATGSGPVAIDVRDFNLDSLPDVAVADESGGTVSLLIGLGNGTFQSPILFNAGSGPRSIAGGDFNADGREDMVVANSVSGNFTVFLGSGTGGFRDPGGNDIPSTGGTVYAPPPAFTFEVLGLVVKITPRIHGMDEVSMEVDASLKLLTGQAVNGLPVISNRKLQSKVRLRNGEWGLVAGLLTSSEARSLSGIAGLSSIPALGELMRTRTRESDTNEVLLVIKPTLLSLPADQFVTTPVRIGTETRPLSPL